MKQKKKFFFRKKIQNGRLKKSSFFKMANSQNFFAKISQIRPWVSRIVVNFFFEKKKKFWFLPKKNKKNIFVLHHSHEN